MKKNFPLLLMMLVMTFSANAADWVINGEFCGWDSWTSHKLTQTETPGVYEFNHKGTFSGQFLLVQLTPDGLSQDWNTKVGSNGNKVIPDTPYSFKTGGDNLVLDGYVSNPTITLDTNNKTITVKGEAAVNDYDTVYLVGDFGSGWNQNLSDFPLSLKDGSDNVWEGSYSLSAQTSYFKMKAGANIYGTGQGNVNIELGKEFTAAQSGEAFTIPAGDYSFSFVLDKNAETGTLTVTGKQSAPDNLYIIGNVNGLGWNPTNGILMTQESEGVFKAEKVFFGSADGSEFGYFSFCTQLMDSYTEGDWNVGIRYGATTPDCEPSLTEPNTIQNGDLAFKVPVGAYSLSVDLNNNSLIIAKDEITPVIPETLYLIGNYDGNQFSPTKGLMLEEKFDGVFLAQKVNITPADGASYGYFSFCTQLMDSYTEGAWNVGTRYGAPVPDVEPSLSEPSQIALSEYAFKLIPGEYEIAIDCNTMSMTVTPLAFSFPENLFVIGNINETGWNPTNGTRLNNDGNGVYSIEKLQLVPAEDTESAYFAFCTQLMDSYTEGDWNVGIRYGAISPDTPAETGLPNTLAIGEYSFLLPAPAKYNLTVNLDLMTLDIQSVPQSVDAIEAFDNNAVYYNLQGIKVSNPTEGVFIKISNGKSTKVIIKE